MRFQAPALVLVALTATWAPASAVSPGEGFFAADLPVALAGDVVARGDGAALLALGEGRAPGFTLVAESLEVTRTFARKTVVVDPVTGIKPFAYYDDPRTETTAFGRVAVELDRAGEESVFFVAPEGAGHTVEVALPDGPLLVSGLPWAEYRPHGVGPEASSRGEASVAYGLRYLYDVPHLALTGVLPGAVVTGNFTLFLWDADVVVLPAGGGAERVRTGQYDGEGPVPVRDGQVGNATLRVTNGRLALAGAPRLEVAVPEVTASVAGTLALPRAVGGFATEDSRYESRGADVRLDGELIASLAIVPASPGRVLASVSGTVTALSLPPAPPLDRAGFLGTAPAAAAAVTGGVAVVAAAAVLVVRHRGALAARLRRAPSEDAAAEAVFALEEGRHEEAAARFEEALRERPDDVTLLVGYGAALENLGLAPAAREAYERAVRVDPARGESHYYYSRALAALGLTASALPHLQRALVLDPRLREMARGDAAFRVFADHPTFLALVA